MSIEQGELSSSMDRDGEDDMVCLRFTGFMKDWKP